MEGAIDGGLRETVEQAYTGRVLHGHSLPALIMSWFFFFFSSRRRHTRCSRDWSSDVCSSDLGRAERDGLLGALAREEAREVDRELRVAAPPGHAEVRTAGRARAPRAAREPREDRKSVV